MGITVNFIIQKLKSKYLVCLSFLWRHEGTTRKYFPHIQGLRQSYTSQVIKSSRNKKNLDGVTAAPFSVSISQLPTAKKNDFINIWKKLLSTAIWTDKNGLVLKIINLWKKWKESIENYISFRWILHVSSLSVLNQYPYLFIFSHFRYS